MKTHNANELQFVGDILGPDDTVRASGLRMGVTYLSGRRLEQAQLISSETSHMILLYTADATTLDDSCYIVVDSVTYVVDYLADPSEPRPKMWTEAFSHIENGGTAGASTPVSPAQTFKTYVDTQDAATLATAEAYTDAHSGGGGGVATGLAKDGNTVTLAATPNGINATDVNSNVLLMNAFGVTLADFNGDVITMGGGAAAIALTDVNNNTIELGGGSDDIVIADADGNVIGMGPGHVRLTSAGGSVLTIGNAGFNFSDPSNNQFQSGTFGINLGDFTGVLPVHLQTILQLASYLLAALVATPPEGSTAFCTNGRKVGEGSGAGTGVPVYFSNGQWRVFSTDLQVTS